MTLKRIRLELARDHTFPEGSRDRGYEFVAPLDTSGHLNSAEWEKTRSQCRVERFWAGEPTELGVLAYRSDDSWVFDYDATRDSDDEPGFKLNAHTFAPGEYVSFKEHDGILRTFRVAAISDLD